MVVMKLPSLKSCIVSSKLSKGIAHNYYGEPAWPNDILYVFPIVILGISYMLLGLAIHQPYNKSEDALAFMTPLEIIPEWYLLSTFNLLRILSSKFIGMFSMFSFPGVLLLQASGENINRYQNPFRRPIITHIFITMLVYSIWLSIGPLEAINLSIPLV